MSKEVAKRVAPNFPTISHESKALVEWCLSGCECSGITSFKVALRNVPTQEERGRLMARQRELIGSLRQHDKGAIAAAVSEMLASYDVARGGPGKTEKERKQVLVKFVQELAGVPTWAVESACEKIRLGTAPEISHVYAPTTIQVRALAVSIAQPWKTEAVWIGNILTAEKYVEPADEEMSKRVGEKMRELADGMRNRLEEERRAGFVQNAEQAKKATLDAIARDYAAHGEQAVKASDGTPISRTLRKMIEAKKAEPPPPRSDPMVL